MPTTEQQDSALTVTKLVLKQYQTETYLCNKQPRPSRHAARLHFWCLLWTAGLCKLERNTFKLIE